MIACLSLTLLPVQASASVPESTSSPASPNKSDATEVKNLELRLNEIKAMDMSKMKAAEKRSLRKEVKTINKRMHNISGGVYVSAGAVIIVLILLLLLL